ncbi:DUF6807 family protein [Flindersiella endophytica]
MAKPAKTGVTIGEVARAAGVSRATVSRVMNGRSTVAQDIAEHVREVAERLSYRPSNVARSLSIGRTNSVALVVPDLGNPLFQQILRGLMAAADEDGCRVLVAESAEDALAEPEIAHEARMRCDALILASPRMADDQLLELLPLVKPAVLINRQLDDGDVPGFWVDYADGMRSIVAHLVELGHRQIVYVEGPAGSSSGVAKAAALKASVEQYSGLDVSTLPGGSTVAHGYAIADQVLATRATAAITFNDLVAFGLLARLNESGVAVPGDISIAGFDDIELARYATPSLTTAAVPQAELGRAAWQSLRDVLRTEPDDEYPSAADGAVVPKDGAAAVRTDGGRFESSQESTGTRFVPKLEVRASTGPVPPARRFSAPSSDTAGLSRSTSGPGASAAWRSDATGLVLEGLGTPLARYQPGDDLPDVHSPRPYLDPIHSLAGVPVTERSPVDHRHHYGLSLAIADVNGTTYWGGRTFVRGQGPTLLPNHGRQIGGSARVSDDGTTLTQEVEWVDQAGVHQLAEDRTLRGVLVPEVEGWALRWRSRLIADREELTFSSPAINGRPGAGYGGLFWRLPNADETLVLAAGAAGETSAHGSRSTWIAFAQRRGESWVSVVLAQPTQADYPWFVRVADYVGAGPAVAWDSQTVIEEDDHLDLYLDAIIVDRQLDRQDAADLAELAMARLSVGFPSA